MNYIHIDDHLKHLSSYPKKSFLFTYHCLETIAIKNTRGAGTEACAVDDHLHYLFFRCSCELKSNNNSRNVMTRDLFLNHKVFNQIKKKYTLVKSHSKKKKNVFSLLRV